MIVHSVKNASIDTNRHRSSLLRYLLGPKCYSVTLDKMEDWSHNTQATKIELGVPMSSVLLEKRKVEDIVSEALKNVNTETSLNSLDFVKHCISAWRIKHIAAVVTVVVYACLLSEARCADVLSLLYEQNYNTILLVNIVFLAFCVLLAYRYQVPKQIERAAEINTTSKPGTNSDKLMLWNYLVNYLARFFETLNRLVGKVRNDLNLSKSLQSILSGYDVEILPYSGEGEQKCAEEKCVTAEKDVAGQKVITEKKGVTEEMDFLKLRKDCKKYPFHNQFIPITCFTETNLPEGYRDNEVCELIKATADLTVQVLVDSGCHSVFLSGQITVFKYTDGLGNNYDLVTGEKRETHFKTCPCETCRHSDKPSNVWWEIYVHTVAYIVFDEDRASHATCKLFYDKEDSQVVILDKFVIDSVDLERDVSVLRSVTCDAALGDRLHKMMKHYSALWKKVLDKYRNISKLVYIVSHPHGCTKQVSLGQLIDNLKMWYSNENIDFTMLTYTAATCPGSAGAAVHCIGLKHQHIHRGTRTRDHGDCNMSAIGLCFY
ncbi:uncharacterized protein LOC106070314 isoform X2 [Biomphalaria glabrata]|nr:uncharacterized protein LOC106070314 isoform X2 [Biomphalaria glabrata]